MDINKQIKACGLIENLLGNGHTFSTLPIDRQRAMDIAILKEQATEDDLTLLEREWDKVNGKAGG